MGDELGYKVALKYLIHRILAISEEVASGNVPHSVAHAAYRIAALEAQENLKDENSVSREESREAK